MSPPDGSLSPAHAPEAASLSVSQAIEARRSIRKYKPVPVPDADLERIFALTSHAPSSANTQPWRFVFVRDPALKSALRAASYNQAQVDAAPVAIVAYSDMRDTLATLDEVVHPGLQGPPREQMLTSIRGFLGPKSDADLDAFGTAQTFIAVGYLSLAAQSLGYATSIMGGFVPAEVKAVLGLPEHAAVAAVIALGVADEEGYTAHRHPLPRILREARPA
ncbi:nitroreductase family protein [Chondromyces apiculatus]|uniref:NADH dehydrogenase n=1 Tax=Chondromyces apiculatus DSM 436 TaxID=1192034 RepID=A0A017T1K5_9BACT|nr:nitroreductase family protein [Chondromyces apiculatus]EYF03083.1 NADH dehydrogenase [Chondromyces apiculatus DSM 436]